ncbi:uncharacterized protein LOC126738956 [Anthonomus grandis grandis]|uniref:uncharacterized protein LOC126738956 n=1 Tax=Anthonomus grandis grandis TaxID=2921223 RepID=UPI0021662F34|nr:uncharacterized protein LOC126738956 [Anthonomus grandis grandis]
MFAPRIIIMLITMVLNQAQNMKEEQDYRVEVSAGAYWKPLPATRIYEATVPLTYETEWTEDTDDHTMDVGNLKCSQLQTNECFVINSINGLNKAFFKELTLLNEHWGIAPLRNNEPSKREKRSLDFIGSGLSWCCGVATLQKLNMVENSDDEIRKRLDTMSQGLSDTVKQMSENSKHFQDYEKLVAATFSDTELRIKSIERFTKQLENKVANTTNEQELLIMTNLYNGYLNLKRMVLLVRTLRRQAIVNSCRHHKIPAEIVNPQVLKKDLEDFESKIANSEQGLAIPTSELAAYFEMPICDCSFTKSSIYVHIKIPIIKKNRNWQLLELITTPFAWYNQTCIIRHQPLYIAVSKNGNNEGDLRQISGTGLHECKPYQNKLCYLPRFSADILQGPECAKILYQGATVKELSQYCPIDCHSATSMTISEIKDETYVITHPKQDMTISCDKNKPQKLDTTLARQGSIKIFLPCKCHLSVGNAVIIPENFPCPENITTNAIVTHIIPATWSNLNSYILNPNIISTPPLYKNISECLNTNWTLEIPHLNLTSSDNTLKNILKSVEKNYPNVITYGDTHSFHGDSFFLIWNITISILVAYILIKQNRIAIVAAVPQIRGEIDCHEKSPSTSVNHEALYIIIYTSCLLFLLFLFTYILYITLRYFKNKPKNLTTTQNPMSIRNAKTFDETILYPIPDPDNDPEPSVEPNAMSRFRLDIKNSASLLSLSPGKKVDASIERIEIE